MYHKETFTGHYTDLNSFVPWKYRVSWIRSLISRGKRICDKMYLPDELKKIRTFAPPGRICNSLVSRFCTDKTGLNDELETEEDGVDIWLKLPYIGPKGEVMTKAFVKKVRRMLKAGKKVESRSDFKPHLSQHSLVSFLGPFERRL